MCPASSPDAGDPVQRRSRYCASTRAKWPLSDEGVRRALSLALDRRALAQADGGDVVAARSLLARPTGAGRAAAPIRRRRARCCGAPAPRARCGSRSGPSPGRRRASRGRSATNSPRIGVQVDVHEASAAERPPGARAWIEWLDPAYGDPAADLHAARRRPREGRRKRRSRSACGGAARLAGDARRAAFRRLDERLGAGGLGAIPLLRANFSTPISSMLVGRGTHPVFDVDLALLSTRS